MHMKRLQASFRRWMRDLYWKLASLPVWARLRQLYDSKFGKPSNRVSGKAYSHLFLSPAPGPDVTVDGKIWSRAAGRLPEGYTVPDRASLQVLLPMEGDHYGALFSNRLPARGSYVDGSVWERARSGLPAQYIIPDPASVRALKPMAAEGYDALFASPVPARRIVVHGQVWERIAAAVPQGYRLPDAAIVDVLDKHKREAGK